MGGGLEERLASCSPRLGTCLGEEGLAERERGVQHEVACLAGGCWGASNPRSAAVSHVVGPLIACRASFAWAGARSLQVGAIRGCKS